MTTDLSYSSVLDSEDSDTIINLAISVLLPYVSGYTLSLEGLSYNWKLTNANKYIAAKARQRDWQRQMLINLDCIEDTLEKMLQQNIPTRKEAR